MQLSDLLERKAPSEHDGYDLADYLINFDIRTFPESTVDQKPANNSIPRSNGTNSTPGESPNVSGYPDNWDTVPIPDQHAVEYIEMLKVEQSDGVLSDFDFWMSTDPKAKLIHELFDVVAER